MSDDKTELFAVAIGSYLDIICEAFNNQAIPRLIDLNGEHFKGITDYPKMVHGDIEKIDMNKLAQYIQTMVGTGVLIPDDELETYVREAGNLPPRYLRMKGSLILIEKISRQMILDHREMEIMYIQRTIKTLPKMMERYKKPKNV